MTKRAAISVLTTTGCRVLVPLAEFALHHERLTLRAPKDTIDRIQAACAQYFEVPLRRLRSTRRTAHTVHARHVAMFLARQMTSCSMPEIARRFNRHDHTTVLHAVRKIEAALKTDGELRSHISRLKAALVVPL